MGKTIRKNDKRSGNQPANHSGSKKPHMQPEKHQKYKNFDDMDPDELEEREEHDYYATDPSSLEKYLEALKRDHITLDINIWECACGEGHLSKLLEQKGFNVKSTDLIDRGYGEGGIDFINTQTKWGGVHTY